METESKVSAAHRLGWGALVLVIIGALNWLLVGVFQYNLIAAIFAGPLTLLARITYILVGVSGLYLVYYASRFLPRARAGGGDEPLANVAARARMTHSPGVRQTAP
jgi:uncharacterized protein